MIAPASDGFGGGFGQQRVSAEGPDLGDRAVLGDFDFEDYVAGAVGGQRFVGKLRLRVAEKKALGLFGRKPDEWKRGELG